MRNTVLLLVAGLGVGAAVAMWTQSGGGPAPVAGSATTSDSRAAPRDETGMAERVRQLEATLDSEIEQRRTLEQRLTELTAEVETLRGRPRAAATESASARDAGPPPPAEGVPPPFMRGGPWRRDAQGGQAEALVAAGFAPDRAAWIERRTSELRMQALQAQYDAQRQGKPFDPGQIQRGDATLRAELGDADYERYLSAMGRPTSVGVQNVLASSPAERAGLKSGDEVVAYDGKRVFDLRDLNALTFEGTAGESVSVTVRRDGQTVHLTLPRGPIGITGGGPGFRGR
jgi:membrane-associated protease RseP (regulator of RpoE activity)